RRVVLVGGHYVRRSRFEQGGRENKAAARPIPHRHGERSEAIQGRQARSERQAVTCPSRSTREGWVEG
ncbi:MAG: hypothetical protein RID07_10395, partial [Lacipirellulaceae bacterium]